MEEIGHKIILESSAHLKLFAATELLGSCCKVSTWHGHASLFGQPAQVPSASNFAAYST